MNAVLLFFVSLSGAVSLPCDGDVVAKFLHSNLLLQMWERLLLLDKFFHYSTCASIVVFCFFHIPSCQPRSWPPQNIRQLQDRFENGSSPGKKFDPTCFAMFLFEFVGYHAVFAVMLLHAFFQYSPCQGSRPLAGLDFTPLFDCFAHVVVAFFLTYFCARGFLLPTSNGTG